MNNDINIEKYNNALLYFITYCNNRYLGAVKLNKLLYYLDFISYRDREESVTGTKYIHLDYGPVPDEVDDRLVDLKAKGMIKVNRDDGNEFQRWEYQSLQEPDLSKFDNYEKKLLEEICKTFQLWDTSKIVNQTHLEAPWFYSKPYEVVNYKYAQAIEILDESDTWISFGK